MLEGQDILELSKQNILAISGQASSDRIDQIEDNDYQFNRAQTENIS